MIYENQIQVKKENFKQKKLVGVIRRVEVLDVS
jgi:hypothetical protein